MGQLAAFLFLSWTTTRDGKAALLGLIPLSGIVLVGGIAFGASFLESRLVKAVNSNATNNAELVGDYDDAILYSRRLHNILPSDANKFRHAKKLINAGRDENGMEILDSLASPVEPGYIPAHDFLGRKLLTEWEKNPELDDKLALARKHFEWVESKAVDGNKYKYDAERFIPIIMFEQNEIEEAIARFQQISNTVPGVVPKLAQYLFDNGKPELAQRHMERGLTALDAMAEQNPNDLKIWNLKYDILEVTEDYQRILKELNTGVQLANLPFTKDYIRLLQSKALHAFSMNFDDLEDEDEVRRKFTLVIKSLLSSPRNIDSLKDFISLAAYPANEKVREWLEEEARAQQTPAMGHLVMGMLDTMQGKLGTGRMYFRLAASSQYKAALLLNNFCEVMSQEEDQLSDALRLANVAIATWGGPPELYKTRGAILLKLDQAEEALVDLEYVDTVNSQDPKLQQVLADCYESLGRDDEAAKSRGKFEELAQIRRRQQEEMKEKAAIGGKR